MIKRYFSLILVFQFGIFGAGFSQQKPLDMSEYEFIKIEKNRIEIPSDSACLNNFFAKIDAFSQTGKGNINVLHIGGSHVQAGTFSHQMRKNFDFFNGENLTSRGIIFPFRAAKTNNPTSYSVNFKGEWTSERNVKRDYSALLGVTGIAVITNDSIAEISVNLNPRGEKRWFMDTLVLIGYAENEKVIPILKQNDTTYIWGRQDIENQTYTYILPEKTDTFTIFFLQTENSADKFVLKGFIPKINSQGIVYHEVGVNGAAVISYLRCENFEQELAFIKPDLVIFGIGINDAVDVNFSSEKFIANYNALIAKVRNVSPDCAFVFITNNDSYRKIRVRRGRYNYQVNQNGVVAQQAFYEIARQNCGGVWDKFEIMGGLRSIAKWQHAGLAQKDKIHFTPKGYMLLGDMLFNALVEYYENFVSLQKKLCK